MTARKSKLYAIECRTPYLWREFKRLAAMNPERYGRIERQDVLGAGPGEYEELWRAPAKEGDFRELLKACEGVAEVFKGM